MMATRPPHWLNAIARFTATVVLPTPPLPAPTAMMILTLTMSRLRSGSRTAFSASSTAASETIRTLYRRAVRERPLQDPLFGHVAGDRELELLALICLEHEDEPQNGGERDDEEDRDEHPEDGD